MITSSTLAIVLYVLPLNLSTTMLPRAVRVGAGVVSQVVSPQRSGPP